MKSKKMIVLMGLVLMLASVAAGCAPLGQVLGQDDGVSDDALAGTAWLLVDMYGEAVPDGPQATLVLKEDQANGIAFCNSYFGDITRDGDEIAFGPLVQTEKFCMEPEGVMDLERNFLQALSVTASYRVEDEMLALLDGEGRTLLVLAPKAR